MCFLLQFVGFSCHTISSFHAVSNSKSQGINFLISQKIRDRIKMYQDLVFVEGRNTNRSFHHEAEEIISMQDKFCPNKIMSQGEYLSFSFSISKDDNFEGPKMHDGWSTLPSLISTLLLLLLLLCPCSNRPLLLSAQRILGAVSFDLQTIHHQFFAQTL